MSNQLDTDESDLSDKSTTEQINKSERLRILPPESAFSALKDSTYSRRHSPEKLSAVSIGEVDGQPNIDDMRRSYNNLQDTFKQLQHELTVAKNQIQRYEEDLEHPVPRHLYAELQQRYNDLQEEHSRMHDEFRMLNYDLQRLMNSTEGVIKERDDYYNFSAGARGSCTPRPDWNKCAQVIDGGYKRWAEISANKSSNELVDVLLNEVVGGNDPLNNADYITCLGTSARVPRFLRYFGEVKYRRLRKRDICLCIKNIWDDKLAYESETLSAHIKLSEFVLEYFTTRFREEKLIYEWSYNLYEGCKRYLSDPNVSLFYAILTEEVDEGVYIHQLSEIARLVRGIYVKHYEVHQDNTDIDVPFSEDDTTPFTKSMLLEVLHATFPTKGQKSLAILLRTAIEECNSIYTELIDYGKILYCDDEGHLSKFLTVFVAQLREEKIIYCAQIMKELPDANEITPADLYQAICRVDPEIPADEVERYLQWIFKKEVSSIDQVSTILTSILAQQLENGALWNHTVYTAIAGRASVADIMSSQIVDETDE
ncbi:hypothetical protein GJ496_006539 [Pomphorhynchus laevis]|nr:hypothetical protein GJ496_006539 [Pomphorhynchus laevis]